MKKHYDLLILGASALGIGIVSAHPELDTVLLEESSSITREFAYALKDKGSVAYAPSSSAAAELRAELLTRNVLREDGIWLSALPPIFANRLKASKTDAYFCSALKNITTDGSVYSVIFSEYGIDHQFTVSKIVDTTAAFISREFFGEPFPEMAEITFNYLDVEGKVHEYSCADDIASARLYVAEKESSILRLATELSRCPKCMGTEIGAAAWVPSAARGNCIEAFDDGVRLVLPEGTPSAVIPKTVNDGKYDVIVIGLGTAGAIAAMTARDEGLKVLGLEVRYVGGGATTLGSVLHYYYGHYSGRYCHLDDRASARNDAFFKSAGIGADQRSVEIDVSLDGVDCRYGAVFTDVKRDGKCIKGAIWYEDGVRHEADSAFVIDATAESAVAINAGCEMQGGRAADGAFMPYSNVFVLRRRDRLNGGFVDDGRINQYDPDSFGREILKSTSSYAHLRDTYDSEYLGPAPLIGMREGLRIVGEETIRFPDLLDGDECREPVYYGWSNIDNHGKDNMLESRAYQDWCTICGLWGWGISIPVPMGAHIPKGYDGLLCAGRNTSCDHDIAMGLRMKDDVQKAGETAGLMASMAIKGGIRAKEIDVHALRSRLFASGALKSEHEVRRIEEKVSQTVYEGELWCKDDEKLTEGLATDAPGYFIWSARSLDKRELLTALLTSENEKVRVNSALALALLDVKSARSVSVLCEAAMCRDGYVPRSGRGLNVPRALAAINALGRIGAREAIPVLFDLLEHEEFIDDLPIEPKTVIANREDYYFQYRAYIVKALCDIAEKAPDCACELQEKISRFVEGKRFTSTMLGPVIRDDLTDVIKRMVDGMFDNRTTENLDIQINLCYTRNCFLRKDKG